MKKILVACGQSQIDVPLRRSLAHLVNSCEIDVVHNGYAAFNQIGGQTYDLIIVDFELSGIDSLELIESVQYIDPGVPVILMLKQTHKPIWSTARNFTANPIVRPFKALSFLRLVDKLLHRQLNRYRQLANTLKTLLETLRTKTSALCAFLVEDSGQILISSGEISKTTLEVVGNLAVGRSSFDEEFKRSLAQDKVLKSHYQAHRDYGLYIVPVFENLRLVLFSSPATEAQETDEIWHWVDTTAIDAKAAFDSYTQQSPRAAPGSRAAKAEMESTPEDHMLIPLHLTPDFDEAHLEPAPPEQEEDEGEGKDEITANWEIISNTSNLLGRLQDYCRVE